MPQAVEGVSPEWVGVSLALMDGYSLPEMSLSTSCGLIFVRGFLARMDGQRPNGHSCTLMGDKFFILTSSATS